MRRTSCAFSILKKTYILQLLDQKPPFVFVEKILQQDVIRGTITAVLASPGESMMGDPSIGDEVHLEKSLVILEGERYKSCKRKL